MLAISLVSEVELTTIASDGAFPKLANAEPDAEDAIKEVDAEPDAIIGADIDVVAKPDAEGADNDVDAKPDAEGADIDVDAKPDAEGADIEVDAGASAELKFKEVGTGREVVGLSGDEAGVPACSRDVGGGMHLPPRSSCFTTMYAFPSFVPWGESSDIEK